MAKISNISAYPNISNIDAADYLIITDAENNLMTKTCTIAQLQSNFGLTRLLLRSGRHQHHNFSNGIATGV